MMVERVLSRVAVGLAMIALFGLGVHLLGERPDRSWTHSVAQQTVPDVSSDDLGDVAGVLIELQGPTVLLTNAMVATAPVAAPAPSLPPLGMFTADAPVEAGENAVAELVSLQGQVGNGLANSITGSAAMVPFMVGQQLVPAVQSAIEASIAALVAHAVPEM